MTRPARSLRDPARARGFTLVELMITLAVLALVVVALTTVMLTAQRGKVSSSNRVESSQAARIALDMMARDLRSAGYGADLDHNPQQPPFAYVDSLQVIIAENLNPFPDTLTGVKGSPLAYNPAGTPKPIPLNGTSWQPPMRYLTGAELVRWTLDLNNDGVVDASDLQTPDAADARRTRNPNDYELVRQVYGDSTNLSAGNNGGNTERVALVLPPGGGVPPLFQVYLAGSSTPWDWSLGPIPASQLPNITRVTAQITAASSKPDWRGQYSQTTYRTDVSSMRNVPSFGSALYAVDGYVFYDVNRNTLRDAGESGIAGAQVILGGLSTVTGSNGYFQLQAPAGTYTLRHIPPAGYGVFTSPDSFVVTVGPATTRSFADTASSGGLIHIHVYDDLNDNRSLDAGESGHGGVKVVLSGGPPVYTAASGDTSVFAPVGGYTLTCTAPDSFVVTTTNPVTGTMINGGSATVSFGLYKAPTGTISGTVFRDLNADGSKEGAEPGLANVWVGVTDDGGSHVLGFAYTDASGNYTITAQSNDPPKTTPYSIFVLPPSGYFPTSPASINGVWLQGGQTLTSKNFGLNSFTKIQLTATRVLCLASSDMGEQDWNGNHTENRVGDLDLVLGADAGGTDQISVWFNRYNSSTLFSTNPDYTRTAPNAVLSLALDTLETADAFRRPDMVTGTKAVPSGNFFVWLNQNTSGNYGIYPTSYAAGMNYRTQDNGDVTSVLTYDCAGGATADKPDIIVGTKSPTAGLGSIEIWRNNNANPTPAFTREEIYPTSGGLSGGSLGEVTSMALADFDGDGLKDLVVTTRKMDYQGQVLFLKNMGKASSPHFQVQVTWYFGSAIPMVVTPVDVDKDGHIDCVVGTQEGTSSGGLYYLRNSTPALFGFTYTRRVDVPGIVQTMGASDFGGTSGSDLAVGFRSNTSSYAGGVRIYYLDLGNLPSNGVDPSGGTLTNWTPALTFGNYNYGVYPSAPSPPYLNDLCAGVKIDASTGALWIFIR